MCFVSQASDPLGQDLGLSVADYKWATRQIMQAAAKCPSCRGRLVSVLEGGYDLEPETNGLAQAVQAHVQELMRVEDPSTMQVQAPRLPGIRGPTYLV